MAMAGEKMEDVCFSLRFDDDVDIDVPSGQHQLMPAASVMSHRNLSVNAHCRACRAQRWVFGIDW